MSKRAIFIASVAIVAILGYVLSVRQNRRPEGSWFQQLNRSEDEEAARQGLKKIGENTWSGKETLTNSIHPD